MTLCNKDFSIVSNASMGRTLGDWGEQWDTSPGYYTNPLGYGYFPYYGGLYGASAYSYAGYHINDGNYATDVCDFMISNCDGLWYPGGIDGTGDYKLTINNWVHDTGNYDRLTSYTTGDDIQFNYPYPDLTNFGAITGNCFFGYIGFTHDINTLPTGEVYTAGYSVGRINIGNIDIYTTRGIGGSGLDSLIFGYSTCAYSTTIKFDDIIYDNICQSIIPNYIFYHPTTGLVIYGLHPYDANLINLGDRNISLSHEICTTNAYKLHNPQIHLYKPCISENLDCSGAYRKHCISDLTSSPYSILYYVDNPVYIKITKRLPMHLQLTIEEAEGLWNDPYYTYPECTNWQDNDPYIIPGGIGGDYGIGIVNLTYTWPEYNYEWSGISGYRLDDEHIIDFNITMAGTYKYWNRGVCYTFPGGNMPIEMPYSGIYSHYYYSAGIKHGEFIYTSGFNTANDSAYYLMNDLCADIHLKTFHLYIIDTLVPSGYLVVRDDETITNIAYTGWNECICDYIGPVGTYILRQDDPSNGEFLGGYGYALIGAYGQFINWDKCPVEYNSTDTNISGLLSIGLSLGSPLDASVIMDDNNYFTHADMDIAGLWSTIPYGGGDSVVHITGYISKNRVPSSYAGYGYKFRPEVGDYLEGYLYFLPTDEWAVYKHKCTITLLE